MTFLNFASFLIFNIIQKKKNIVKKKIKQTKNDQKIGFSRKRIYRKMWVSREIEIPEWEEVPSLRDRNNIYYIEYYIVVWSPARERNLEKVWRLRGWYLTIYTKKKNMTWIFSKFTKMPLPLGRRLWCFLGDTCIYYCFFKKNSNLNYFIRLKYYTELIRTHKWVEVANVDNWVKWYLTIGWLIYFMKLFIENWKNYKKKSVYFLFFSQKIS